MELVRDPTRSVSPSRLITCLALLVIVAPASTQDSFAFLQPLPTPIQCQTYAFAWTGGTPTYTLSISVSMPWNASYGIYPLDGEGFPWVMPVPAGHNVSFLLRDSANHEAKAGPVTIAPSDDTSCFDSTTSTSSTTTTSPTKTSSTTTSSTTTSSTTTSSSTPSSSTKTSTTTPSTIATSTSEPPSTSSESTSSAPPSLSPFIGSQSSTSQTPSTSSETSATPVIQTTILITPTTSPSNASQTSNRTIMATGAIAGVAVAGAFALVLVGAMVWFCRRRKRRATPVRGEMDALSSYMSDDPDAMSRPRSGPGPPLPMSEAVTSTHRLGPFPAAAPSSSSRSDPFAELGDNDGTRQLLLPTGSEDYVPASYRGPWGGAAHPRSASESFSPSGFPQVPSITAQGRPFSTADDSDDIQKSPTAHFTPESPHIRALPSHSDSKPDPLPRDLPLPPSHPPRGPDSTMARSYAAVPTDERSPLSTGVPFIQYEEDGGVRLAGGMPGEVLDDDSGGNDSRRWTVQPPPYERFR